MASMGSPELWEGTGLEEEEVRGMADQSLSWAGGSDSPRTPGGKACPSPHCLSLSNRGWGQGWKVRGQSLSPPPNTSCPSSSLGTGLSEERALWAGIRVSQFQHKHVPQPRPSSPALPSGALRQCPGPPVS